MKYEPNLTTFINFTSVTGATGGVSFKSKLSATIRIVIYCPDYPSCKVSAHSELFEIFDIFRYKSFDFEESKKIKVVRSLPNKP